VRQHPGYEYRLAGKGELVLTEVTKPSASLELPEGFDRALIVLVRRDQVLAELTSDEARRIALAPGEYAVRVLRGTLAFAARFTVAAGEEKQIAWADLQSVSSPVVAEKGHAEDDQPDGIDSLTPEAKAEYLGKFVSVGDLLQLTVTNHQATVTNDFALYRGKYREKLGEGDFFELVARPDLAESYRVRRGAKIGLFAGGGALILGGFADIFFFNKCNLKPGDPGFADQCVSGSRLVAPIAVSLVGFAACFAAYFVPQHPLEASEPKAELGVAPLAAAKGGGLQLSGTF
jgi:hypothetical protein